MEVKLEKINNELTVVLDFSKDNNVDSTYKEAMKQHYKELLSMPVEVRG